MKLFECIISLLFKYHLLIKLREQKKYFLEDLWEKNFKFTIYD